MLPKNSETMTYKIAISYTRRPAEGKWKEWKTRTLNSPGATLTIGRHRNRDVVINDGGLDDAQGHFYIGSDGGLYYMSTSDNKAGFYRERRLARRLERGDSVHLTDGEYIGIPGKKAHYLFAASGEIEGLAAAEEEDPSPEKPPPKNPVDGTLDEASVEAFEHFVPPKEED